jgi:hypothetical protein
MFPPPIPATVRFDSFGVHLSKKHYSTEKKAMKILTIGEKLDLYKNEKKLTEHEEKIIFEYLIFETRWQIDEMKKEFESRQQGGKSRHR